MKRLASNALQLLLALAFLWVMLFIAQSAHAGPQLKSDLSWKQLRKHTRITVTRPQRVHGRALAGFPARQAVANATLAAAYVAGTAYNASRLIPSGSGIIANILLPRFR